MYSESGRVVTITLEHSDYELLLLSLGYALGGALKEGEEKLANSMIKLANTINEGNPQWNPYQTEAELLH